VAKLVDRPETECIVYCVMNIARPLDKAIYIGVTGKDLAERKYRHFYRAKNGSPQHFHRALMKYGEDAFIWVVIDIKPTYREALEAEREYISRMRAAQYNLYNKTDGGEGVQGQKFSAESRAKMAAAKLGKPNHWSNGKMPQSIRERLAALRRSEKRIWTESAKASCRKNARKANAVRRRAVICLNDNAQYESVTEAANAYGVRSGQVSRYCSGTLKSRKGLQFAYADSAS